MKILGPFSQSWQRTSSTKTMFTELLDLGHFHQSNFPFPSLPHSLFSF